MLIRRSDRGLCATWWYTTDRVLLTAVLLLIAAGVIITLAASPPVAERLGLEFVSFRETSARLPFSGGRDSDRNLAARRAPGTMGVVVVPVRRHRAHGCRDHVWAGSQRRPSLD